MAAVRHAKIRMIENAGHACFWDEAAAYNQCLRDFAEAL
jgi:pimeloyl-ACP methyl ester carboxylesterase